MSSLVALRSPPALLTLGAVLAALGAALSAGSCATSAEAKDRPRAAGPGAPAATSADEADPTFRLPADTRPLEYALTLDVDPSGEGITGAARIQVKLDRPRRAIWMHGRNLEVTRASVAGKPARWSQVDDDGLARLALDEELGPGVVEIALEWRAKYNAALESVYRVQFEGAWYVFTQFEALSAREAFPCFDEPGFKTPFSLAIRARPGDAVFANTPVKRTREVGALVETELAKTQPLPTYLVAFAVGPFETLEGAPLPPTDKRPEPLPIRGIAPRGQAKRLAASLSATAEVAAALERWFDISYPYEKLDLVAVPDFSAGAMENAGLITFRDSLLYVDDASPIGLQKANLAIIAHEVAHQWFGNLVTMAWWDDLWLNEAFASWIPVEIIEEIRPAFRARVQARSTLDWVTGEDSLVTARQIRQPIVNRGDIENAFDGITYSKGQAVIAMFENFVGKEDFQQGVRSYLRAHALGNATTDDLLEALSSASGQDITRAFKPFLEQPGVPHVAARLRCERGAPPVVELTQERFLPVGSSGDRKQSWQVPVCVRFIEGRVGKTQCTLLTESSAALELEAKSCPAAIHPNADGVGYYRWSLPEDQMKALAPFVRLLTPGERISYANAIRAGEQSARLTFAAALEAALPLARDEEPSVAMTPLSLLSFAWRELVEPDMRPRVQKRIVSVYKPVLDELKLVPRGNEDPRSRERRLLALGALASAEEPRTIDALAKLGDEVLGRRGDRTIRLEKVHGDLLGPALAAAVKKGGPAAWDEVNERLTTESDSMLRRHLIGALAGARDEPLAERARELALDPRLKANESWLPFMAQVADPRTREALWSWLPAKYDAFRARMPESFSDAGIAEMVNAYCSVERAAEVEAFFRGQPKKTPALEVALRQSVESITLCAARRAAHQASARQLFAK
jgi:cytosol alanyl aminopeptidase